MARYITTTARTEAGKFEPVIIPIDGIMFVGLPDREPGIDPAEVSVVTIRDMGPLLIKLNLSRLSLLLDSYDARS